MLADTGLVASMRVQVPLTDMLDPVLIGPVTTGAAVHTGDVVVPAACNDVTVITGCAFTTEVHKSAGVPLLSSIP
jgi:hypothetical protein